VAESLQSTPRHLRDAPSLRLGIDLGGSKIEIVALDVHGTERLRRRIPTPKEDYAATLAAVAGLVNDAEHELYENTVINRVRRNLPALVSRLRGVPSVRLSLTDAGVPTTLLHAPTTTGCTTARAGHTRCSTRSTACGSCASSGRRASGPWP